MVSNVNTSGASTHSSSGGGSEPAKSFPKVVVPILRFERIKQLNDVGENIRRIAREEAKYQEDVRRIVRSYATQQYIEEVRMALYGLLENAIESIAYALDSERDGKLAYRLLVDLGVIQKRI
jgi:hypothetical protein